MFMGLNKNVEYGLEQVKHINSVVGHPFNKFFKEIKWFSKNKIFKNNATENDKFFLEHMNKIDKKDVIIFSVDEKKLDNLPKVNKRVIFPFEKIFIEYPMVNFIVGEQVGVKYTNGFFLDSIKDDDNKIKAILFVSFWIDQGMNKKNVNEEGVTPKFILLPFEMINKKVVIPNNISKEDERIANRILNILKKICYLIEKKQYQEYYKWTSGGVISKNIVYSHDVRSHKRHFWKDSGRFIIPTLPKKEIIKRGYGIDEIVFRGYEVRRNIPYKIIDTFKVGEEKKKKDDQRVINLLKRKNWRNENKLGLIISKIFVSHHIKKNDRRAIKPLELDYYIHDLKIAFEYDGEQHFNKKICEEIFKSDFKLQKQRDIRKNAMCRKKGITLIRVRYNEPLTINNIKKKIKDKGINFQHPPLI